MVENIKKEKKVDDIEKFEMVEKVDMMKKVKTVEKVEKAEIVEKNRKGTEGQERGQNKVSEWGKEHGEGKKSWINRRRQRKLTFRMLSKMMDRIFKALCFRHTYTRTQHIRHKIYNTLT